MGLRNKALLCLIAWRLTSVYVVQTFHVPDEYWQSLEVAHRLAFGYGHLTWEWRVKIRSYLYPFLVSLLYRLLALLRLDDARLLTTLPRVCQAVLSGYADYRFYVWTRSKWALFSLCTNWFLYYCASRTLANTLETSLTTVALSVFPWPQATTTNDGSRFLWIVGFVVAARPTAAVLWAPLCLYHIYGSAPRIRDTLKSYIIVGACTLFYSTLVDSLCYGAFVVTPWEFFRVNVLDSIGDFYGTHHPLWYLGAGLPVLLGPQILVFPLAVWATLRNSVSQHRQQRIALIAVICWTIAVYSLLDHKEFRFILPLLPIIVRVSAGFPFGYRITESKRKALLVVLVLSNVIPGLYLSLVHQRGSLDIMRVLEDELKSSNGTGQRILFLTPCHATPLYSHLHVNVPIRFLTCEPNFLKFPGYIDEADEFFSNPASWLSNNYRNKNSPVPELLVIFDNLTTRIAPFLNNYRLLAKVFHAHFPQAKYGEYIMLYRRK